MERRRVLFIGRLSIDNTPCAGEVMKNQLFCDRLDIANSSVNKINVTKYKRRITLPFLFLKIALEILIHRYQKVIVSTHDILAMWVLTILGQLGQSHKTIYWVIGGGVSRKIENGILKCKYYKKLSTIVVEDISIEKHFNKMGFSNVITVPNFKPIFRIDKPFSVPNNRFVFVSRITPLKGCDIILSAVKELNRNGFSFEVDFYGYIEKGYPFEEYIMDIQNVHYKGVLSLKTKQDYEFLGGYTALLFPTFYPNEGFPGTIIDGFIAGLPIISTDWRYNSHILGNNKYGWLLPVQDSNYLASVMEEIMKGQFDMKEISDNCLERAEDFDVNTVLSDSFLSQMSLV